MEIRKAVERKKGGKNEKKLFIFVKNIVWQKIILCEAHNYIYICPTKILSHKRHFYLDRYKLLVLSQKKQS